MAVESHEFSHWWMSDHDHCLFPLLHAFRTLHSAAYVSSILAKRDLEVVMEQSNVDAFRGDPKSLGTLDGSPVRYFIADCLFPSGVKIYRVPHALAKLSSTNYQMIYINRKIAD